MFVIDIRVVLEIFLIDLLYNLLDWVIFFFIVNWKIRIGREMKVIIIVEIFRVIEFCCFSKRNMLVKMFRIVNNIVIIWRLIFKLLIILDVWRLVLIDILFFLGIVKLIFLKCNLLLGWIIYINILFFFIVLRGEW